MARYSSAAWRAYKPDAPTGRRGRAVQSVAAIRGSGDCRILGLDPGSRRTGFGVIDLQDGQAVHVANGCIDVAGVDLALRLRRIYEGISALIVEHQPHEIAIERVFMHRNADSALKLGQARGAALCAAVALGGVAHEYAPRAIKQAVTGYGAAEKPQVATMVMMLLSLSKRPTTDAADALAIALCHAQHRRVAVLLRHGA